MPSYHKGTDGEKGESSANIAQYNRVAEKRKGTQNTKANQTHPSPFFRHLESMATQSHSQYVIVAPAASLI